MKPWELVHADQLLYRCHGCGLWRHLLRHPYWLPCPVCLRLRHRKGH